MFSLAITVTRTRATAAAPAVLALAAAMPITVTIAVFFTVSVFGTIFVTILFSVLLHQGVQHLQDST